MEESYSEEVLRTDGKVGSKERRDHIKARLGFDRLGHRVRPGLYAIGSPGRGSMVLVTANYSLSFDAVRSCMQGRNAYLLVLDTKGINVWCAAGKGTFGTAEVLKAVEATGLKDVVDHRVLILPQLSAPGVTVREVKDGCGFKVEFGPVRSEDLPAYLDGGACTEAMRTVRFNLRDRLVLAPVELRNYRWGLLLLLLAAWLVPFYGLMAMVLTLSGLFLFPALLPYLPHQDLSFRGMFLGALLVTPFVLYQLSSVLGTLTLLAVAAEYLLLVPWLGYLGLNFTGSTTFASRTGVKREIFTYILPMALMAVSGAAIAVIGALGYWGGWF